MTPAELDAVRARAERAAAQLAEGWPATGPFMARLFGASAGDVPALLALVAELTRERDEALQGYRDGQAAAGELVADLLRERDTAEAKGRRWAIEALRDRDALLTYREWGETTDRVDDGSFCILDARDLWSVSDYLEHLAAAQPTPGPPSTPPLASPTRARSGSPGAPMATDLPNWVYDMVIALQAWENDHPVLFQQLPNDEFARVTACGCVALQHVPTDVRDRAAVIASYVARSGPLAANAFVAEMAVKEWGGDEGGTDG